MRSAKSAVTTLNNKPGLRFSKRDAITIIEVVVVIGIIMIVIFMLLPALQRVRGAADRLACQSNLRNIGIAMSHYHNDYHVLPKGISNSSMPGSMPFSSWCLSILPYLEQDEVHKKAVAAYAKDNNFINNPPHDAVSVSIAAYVCPSDGRLRRERYPFFAFTHYLGIIGTNYLKNDGVFFKNSRIRFADIKDGLSNTAMIGERPPTYDGALGWWYAGWGQDWINKSGSAEMILGVHELNSYGSAQCQQCYPGPYPFQYGNTVCDFLHFWSHHPGGANFLFADCSVHFLKYSADPILDALATRAGGEPITIDD